MGVVADGAVAHGGEHHRHGQLDLRRQRADKLSLFVPADAVGLPAQKNFRFHRLPKGVHRGIGHLRGVDEDPVPIYGITLGIAHGRQQHAAASGLLVDFFNRILVPVGVVPEGAVTFADLQGMGGTEAHAALAIHALALVGGHAAPVLVKAVYTVGTLLFTQTAVYAPYRVADNLKLRINIVDTH